MELLTQNEVVQLTRLSLPTIWRLRKAGEFPSPFKIGKRRLLWERHEVETWIVEEANRSTENRAGTA